MENPNPSEVFPIGTWIEVMVPSASDQDQLEPYACYTYIDPSAGLSAQRGHDDGHREED